MAIVLRQPAETQLYGEAGRIIGEAARAKEEYRRATEIAERLADVKTQQEMALFSHQLALDRAKFAEQMDFEKEKRSQLWDLEKMEIRSKLDFAEGEKKRAQTNAEYDTGMKYIAENADKFPPGFREKAEYDLYFDKIIKAPAVSYPKPETEKQIFTQAKIQQVLGALTTGSPVSPMGIPLPTLTKKEDKEAYVINELGPNWRQIAPEAIPLVEGKEYVPPTKPVEIPADAFYENGTWKIIRNGQKMKWIE